MEAEYIYWLTDEKENKREYKIPTNSVFLLGANNAEKCRLTAWIEQ